MSAPNLEFTYMKLYSCEYPSPHLVFTVKIENKSDEEVVLRGLAAYCNAVFRELNPRTLFLGLMQSLPPACSIRPRGREVVKFYLPVSPVVISYLDSLRIERDESVKFDVDVYYEVLTVSSGRSSFIPGAKVYSDSGENYLEIPHSKWLELLEWMRIKKVKILEIPFREVPEELEETVESLNRAIKLVAHGVFPEALNACRKALEDLKNYLIKSGFSRIKTTKKEQKRVIDFKKLYGGGRIGSALDKLFSSLRILSDIGSHAGRSKLLTRSDVELTMITIFMLINSILDQLNASSLDSEEVV